MLAGLCQTNLSVKTVLVYEGNLDPSVEEDGFLDAVVPADRLLGRTTRARAR